MTAGWASPQLAAQAAYFRHIGTSPVAVSSSATASTQFEPVSPRTRSAARERGCTTAVLVASPEGAELYRALGFETHRQPPDRWFYLP